MGLIGAGKFGSMFLSQIPTSRGLKVSVITDLDVDRAKQRCRDVGWSNERIASTRFMDNAFAMCEEAAIDVVVEATGDPVVGVAHADAAIKAGLHIVMVNVEADVLAGALMARKAKAAGVVYSMAYGDQPALICELVEWAQACGFDVVAAGKGTKYLASYHSSTPDTVWEHYGLTPNQAAKGGMNSKMFNSFLDGTKSALEMAAVANATYLTPAPDGLTFPPVGVDKLANVLRPKKDGGCLHHKGQVEVVSSLERDGSPVSRDLRWGVYVVIEAPNDYTASCFHEYGMNTDETGRYAAMYKPFHLIGLELNISVLSAAINNKPTGSNQGFVSDVVATAKRDLKAGEILDGEGGYTLYGKIMPSEQSLEIGGLPIGLSDGVRLNVPVLAGQQLCWSHVDMDETSVALGLRREMEKICTPVKAA